MPRACSSAFSRVVSRISSASFSACCLADATICCISRASWKPPPSSAPPDAAGTATDCVSAEEAPRMSAEGAVRGARPISWIARATRSPFSALPGPAPAATGTAGPDARDAGGVTQAVSSGLTSFSDGVTPDTLDAAPVSGNCPAVPSAIGIWQTGHFSPCTGPSGAILIPQFGHVYATAMLSLPVALLPVQGRIPQTQSTTQVQPRYASLLLATTKRQATPLISASSASPHSPGSSLTASVSLRM